MSLGNTVSRRAFLSVAAISNTSLALAQTNAPADSADGMLTFLFSMTVKAGREQEFADVTKRLTTTTRAEDKGCLTYVFLQQRNSPRDYVLYEQWRDQAALDAHLARLQTIFGPAAPGRGLPIALLDFFETTRIIRYQPVA